MATVPYITDEERAAALVKAGEVRKARAAVLGDVRSGAITVADVLERSVDDPVCGRIRVRALVLAIPGVGKARAAAFLEGAGIDPDRRVAGLGHRQRASLVAYAEERASRVGKAKR